MPNFSISLGGANIDLTTGDLGDRLKPGLHTIMHLSEELGRFSSTPLSDVPEGALETGFTTERDTSWDLGEVNITLSVQPTATGTITITKSGSLFDAKGVLATVPDGSVYVSTALKVGLAVSGGAAFSSGNIGVSGNIDTDDQFEVINHRCFPATTLVKDALTQTFGSFVLPFKSSGIEGLNDNDFIEFSFIGKLLLGFGMTYGYTGMLGGRSLAEIKASAGAGGFGKAVLTAQPTFTVGAGFSVKYKHMDAFHVIAGRHKSGTTNGASLYLLPRKRSETSEKFTAGITLAANAEFDAAVHVDEILSRSAAAAVSRLAPEERAEAASVLGKSLKAAQSGVDALTGFLNGKVNELLDQKGSSKMELELLSERISEQGALFHYEFDFAADPTMAGYADVMRGDYASAISRPGVTLGAGSFIENEFIRRGTVSLRFFDLARFKDVTTYLQKTMVTYAGNGTYHLQAKTGVVHESGLVGHTGQCQVYFTAKAAEASQNEAVSGLEVDLVFVLRDEKNADASSQTIKVLQLLHSPSLSQDLDQIPRSGLNDKVVQVTCMFPESAFDTLSFDAFLPNGRPGPLPHPSDARNYTRFAEAVAGMDSTAPDLFKSYDRWAIYNVVKNDRDGSTIPPNRRSSGNIGGSGWPSAFPFISTIERVRAGCYFEAGRLFMNLCEDLKLLGSDIDRVATDQQYEQLLDELNGIIRQDVPVFFIKAVLVALLQSMNTAPANVRLTGAAGASIELSFDAALQVGSAS